MEKQLFDWTGWDQQGTASFSFYNVVLKVDVGPFKTGKKFGSAFVDYENGLLALYPENDEIRYEFDLVISVKENIGAEPPP